MAYGEDRRASRRAALPRWPGRLRAFFTTKLLETADRFFDQLPLQADRYGRGFLLALGGILGFIGLSYWTVSMYWDVDWFAREDGALEWASVAMFLTSATMAAAARSLARLGHSRLGSFHLLLAIALLLISMEEISWGQRLFGWSTPEVLTGANEQNETNFHNITGFERVLYSGLLYGSLMALVGAGARVVLHRPRRVTTADFILPSLLLSPPVGDGVHLDRGRAGL